MCAFLFQMCAREPEGRKIHASSCNIDSPDPLSPCLRTVMVTKNSNPGGFSVEKVGRNNCDKDWKNTNLLFKRRSRHHRDSRENNVITNEKYFERCLGILMAYKLSEHKSGFCIRCPVRWRLMTSALLRWLNTVLAVCEYMSFAKSWQEKGCSSHTETW